MSTRLRNLRGPLFVNLGLALLVIIWMIPTIGLFISSFRNRFDIQTSGWWSIFPHREWQAVEVIDPKEAGLDPDNVMEIKGVSGTFDELQEGIEAEDGSRVTWVGNKRIGKIEVQDRVWTVSWDFTLDNYRQVLAGRFTSAGRTGYRRASYPSNGADVVQSRHALASGARGPETVCSRTRSPDRGRGETRFGREPGA